jgi:hypothetical protein
MCTYKELIFFDLAVGKAAIVVVVLSHFGGEVALPDSGTELSYYFVG